MTEKPPIYLATYPPICVFNYQRMNPLSTIYLSIYLYKTVWPWISLRRTWISSLFIVTRSYNRVFPRWYFLCWFLVSRASNFLMRSSPWSRVSIWGRWVNAGWKSSSWIPQWYLTPHHRSLRHEKAKQSIDYICLGHRRRTRAWATVLPTQNTTPQISTMRTTPETFSITAGVVGSSKYFLIRRERHSHSSVFEISR